MGTSNNSNHNTNQKTLVPVKSIDFTVYQPQRAGVLIYQRIGQTLYFCLGRDRKYQELTDFAGGVRYISQKETAFFGAWREFQEESLKVFSDVTKEKLLNSWALCSEKSFIILCESDIPQTLAVERFNKKLTQDSEVDRIIWVRANKIASGHSIYSRFQNSLKSVKNVCDDLLIISKRRFW